MGYVDTHVHLWSDGRDAYPYAPGFEAGVQEPPTFLAPELRSYTEPAGVDRVVLIQMSFYGTDNRYMLDAIATEPQRFRGVAVVDVDAPDLDRTVRELKAGGVRGFRVQSGRGPIESWAQAPGMARLFALAGQEDMVICPLIEPSALPSLARACEASPETAVAVDHFCRIHCAPQIDPAGVDALCDLARYPRAMVKVSAFYGLGAPERYGELLPLIDRLLEAYGPARLMWGSDAPYQITRGDYAASVALMRERLDVSEADRAALLAGNAAREFFGETG